MLDGFDLGAGTLTPFIARNDTEKRLVYNSMGPFWDGNEVWLITAGGVTFAAFPNTYAVMFSALYTPLLLLLFALILRGVALEFRGKEDAGSWRRFWDVCHFIGSFVPALLLGVAFANIFQGIPIDGEGIFHGNLLTLLNPYGLLGGVLFCAPLCRPRRFVACHKDRGAPLRQSWEHGRKTVVSSVGCRRRVSRSHVVLHKSLQQLPGVPSPVGDSFDYCGGPSCHTGLHCKTSVVESMVCFLSDHCRGHSIWSDRALPQSFAFQYQSGIQPDDI